MAAVVHQICAAQLLHKLGLLTSLVRSYTLSTMHAFCELLLCGAHIHSVDPKLRCYYYCTAVVHIFTHTQQQHACRTSLSPSIFPTSLRLFSTKNKLAKLKGLLGVQPSGRRKDEPRRGFISVSYYKM